MTVILKCDVKSVLAKRKRNKATGPDEIAM